MSHFSEIKTSLRNQQHLVASLKHLGWQVEEAESGVDVRGYFGAVQGAHLKIATDTHYDIGFAKDATGNFQVVGDWELLPKVSGIEQSTFLNQVKREYARASVLAIAKEKGLEVSCEEHEGVLQMVVTQW